jgi:hypothetical protein
MPIEIEVPSQFRAQLDPFFVVRQGHTQCPSRSLLFRNTCATCFSKICGSHPPERLFSTRPVSYFALLQRASVPSFLSRVRQHESILISFLPLTMSADSMDQAYSVRFFALLFRTHWFRPVFTYHLRRGLCIKKRKLIERHIVISIPIQDPLLES